MTTDNFNSKVLKFCAWMGPAFVVMWITGAGPVTSWVYLPPPSAANSAAVTVASYTDQLTQVRVGCVFMIFSSVLYTFWGSVVSLYARKAEKGYPILFYVQMVSLAACVVVVLLIGFFWGVAAFRPGEISPEITQALNDVAWFGVLFTGAPFTAWAFALAAAVLMDKSERPVFARWTAYMNIFAGLMYFEACFLLFFKTGPFSQNGIFVFYLPMATFFIWILVLTFVVIKAINEEGQGLQ